MLDAGCLLLVGWLLDPCFRPLYIVLHYWHEDFIMENKRKQLLADAKKKLIYQSDLEDGLVLANQPPGHDLFFYP
jgi:hypothetical protein